LKKSTIYIYPGSFDPVTNGHLDIILRASSMCDRLIVAVGRNRDKRALFTVEERICLLRTAIAAMRGKCGKCGKCVNVEVAAFTGLLADYALSLGASVLVKGLRAMSDFEFEFQMALLNKHIADSIETIFLMTGVQYTYLSSSAVKELAKNGASLDGLVPECVMDSIVKKIQNSKEQIE
jgi:pantetheine-phosphate adenylyltransferase